MLRKRSTNATRMICVCARLQEASMRTIRVRARLRKQACGEGNQFMGMVELPEGVIVELKTENQ